MKSSDYIFENFLCLKIEVIEASELILFSWLRNA